MSSGKQNSEKKKAFWPIPGGLKNYLDTIQHILYFIDMKSPSTNHLTDYFLSEFERVKSRKNARGYVNNVIRTSGLVSFENTKRLSLTLDGREYLENRDPNHLFEVLDTNIIGFSEILLAIKEGNTQIDSIHQRTIDILKGQVRWTSNYPVKYRLDWLRALGLVHFRNGNYRLISDSSTSDQNEISETSVEIINRNPPDQSAQDLDIETIIHTLTSTQHDSSNPRKFEGAIAQAFEFLGFSAEHLGKPGDTDVLVVADSGKDQYMMIVDGKTSKNKKIPESQISWATITDHKERHDADYSIIVAPDFAGGEMIKRSINFGVILLKTSTLIDILKIHIKTPLNLVDFKILFSNKGLLNFTDNESFTKKISSYNKKYELMPKIMLELIKLHNLNVNTSITDIYWSLERKFSEYEISQTVDLLLSLDFITKDESGNYISLSSLKTIERKLQTMTDLFNENSQ